MALGWGDFAADYRFTFMCDLNFSDIVSYEKVLFQEKCLSLRPEQE